MELYGMCIVNLRSTDAARARTQADADLDGSKGRNSKAPRIPTRRNSRRNSYPGTALERECGGLGAWHSMIVNQVYPGTRVGIPTEALEDRATPPRKHCVVLDKGRVTDH
eukprot:3884523-Rhodomonas_salina.1